MSDQGNMFSEQDDDPNAQQQQQQQNSGDPAPSSDNPFTDKLKDIKNENGEPKYKDVGSALEALAHSQQFIETLKTEKQQLEEQYTQSQAELEKRQSVEDVVKSLTTPQTKNDDPADPPQSPSLDEEKVRNLINDTLQSQNRQQREETNLSSVIRDLTEKYGEQAKEVIRTRAKELNTTPTELEKLARQNPSMALGLLGGANVNSNAPSTSSVTPPHKQDNKLEMPKPERSLMRGASNDELVDAWRQVQDYTYKKYNVEK